MHFTHTISLNGSIVTQPLYVSDVPFRMGTVTIKSPGSFVGTQSNHLYGLLAVTRQQNRDQLCGGPDSQIESGSTRSRFNHDAIETCRRDRYLQHGLLNLRGECLALASVPHLPNRALANEPCFRWAEFYTRLITLSRASGNLWQAEHIR